MKRSIYEITFKAILLCRSHIGSDRFNGHLYFNIWKKRILLKDKYCGKGHITRPVGVIFEIRKNQKK